MERTRGRGSFDSEDTSLSDFKSSEEISNGKKAVMNNHDLFEREIANMTTPHPLDIKLMAGGPPCFDGSLADSGVHLGKRDGSIVIETMEDKLEMQQRELEEVRARAAQMEKTMRWWSDCTANWREKWAKVRSERNKAREEVRQFRMKLEAAVKECLILKRGKQDVMAENDLLRYKLKEYEEDSVVRAKLMGASHSSEKSVNNNDLTGGEKLKRGNEKEVQTDENFLSAGQNSESEPNSQSASKDLYKSETDKELEKVGKKSSSDNDVKNPKVKSKVPSPSEEKLEQKVFMLEMRLEESAKTLHGERQEKDDLHQKISSLQQELTSLRHEYEEVNDAKLQLTRELSTTKSAHQRELGRMTSDLEDEASTRSCMDRRIADLRKELELMQSENAAEWGKRERLETEKLSLERENKKLRTQIQDLEETLVKKSKQATAETEQKIKDLDDQLTTKIKELTDLKHYQAKMKKIQQEKQSELEHIQKVAENSDAEVKRLRSRVEELKRDLTKSEDEIDSYCNQVRKLERNLEESSHQNANLNTQIGHLQTRLRAQASNAASPSKKRSSAFSTKSRHNWDLSESGDAEHF